MNVVVAPKISPYAVLVRQCRSSCVALFCSLFRTGVNSGKMAHGILNRLTEGGAEHERIVTTLTIVEFEIIKRGLPILSLYTRIYHTLTPDNIILISTEVPWGRFISYESTYILSILYPRRAVLPLAISLYIYLVSTCLLSYLV
jgi:hypothetical protein